MVPQALLRPGSPSPARGRALVKGLTTNDSPAAVGPENQPSYGARRIRCCGTRSPLTVRGTTSPVVPTLPYIRITWGGSAVSEVPAGQKLPGSRRLTGRSQCFIPPAAVGTAAGVYCLLRRVPARTLNPPPHVGRLRREQRGVLHPCRCEGHLGLPAVAGLPQEATDQLRDGVEGGPEHEHSGSHGLYPHVAALRAPALHPLTPAYHDSAARFPPRG